VNFGGVAGSSALGEKEKSKAAAGGLSTSRRAHAAKQLRGWARGGTREGGACPPCGRSGRARDPHQITVALPYLLSSIFCEIRPKFELQSKTHQNKSCSEFYKL